MRNSDVPTVPRVGMHLPVDGLHTRMSPLSAYRGSAHPKKKSFFSTDFFFQIFLSHPFPGTRVHVMMYVIPGYRGRFLPGYDHIRGVSWVRSCLFMSLGMTYDRNDMHMHSCRCIRPYPVCIPVPRDRVQFDVHVCRWRNWDPDILCT